MMLAASGADLLSTFMVTPDLSLEGNPLVAWLGGGWWSLIAAKAGAMALAVFLLRYGLRRLRPLYMGARCADASALMRHLSHDKQRWLRSSFGVTLGCVVIATGVWAAFTNLSGWLHDQSQLVWFYALIILTSEILRRFSCGPIIVITRRHRLHRVPLRVRVRLFQQQFEN